MQIRRLADVFQTKRKVPYERITHHCLYKHVTTVRKDTSNISCVVLSHKIHNFKPNNKRASVGRHKGIRGAAGVTWGLMSVRGIEHRS